MDNIDIDCHKKISQLDALYISFNVLLLKINQYESLYTICLSDCLPHHCRIIICKFLSCALVSDG